MENSALLKKVRNMAISGKNYESIFEELDRINANFTDKEVNFAKNLINKEIVSFQLASQVKAKAKLKIIIGLILFFVSLFITVYFLYVKTDFVIISFFSLISGFYLAKESYLTYKKPIEELILKKYNY